jgi:hypothetical protein
MGSLSNGKHQLNGSKVAVRPEVAQKCAEIWAGIERRRKQLQDGCDYQGSCFGKQMTSTLISTPGIDKFMARCAAIEKRREQEMVGIPALTVGWVAELK